MVAYLYRMPAGIAGEVTRAQCTIEAQLITEAGETDAPDAYGIAAVIDATSGAVRKVKSTDAAISGLLVRPYPTNAGTDALGTATPPASGACDLLRRGYMSVLLSGSTDAVKGGIVYVWKSAASGSHIVGGFEAANPSSDGFALSAYFTGDAAVGSVAEIAFNI